jgi:hypothetical protein
MLHIGFTVPLAHDPERHLIRQIRELPDEAPRKAEFLAHLEGLAAARADAARARGPVAAQRAIADLSGRFANAGCGAAARQRDGDIGRTPIYLDSRRDLDVQVGADLLDGLRAPLSILLRSARWLSTELAATTHAQLRERYARLRSRDPVVTLSDLQFAAADVLATGGAALPEVVTDFRLRWAEILGAGRSGLGETRLSSGEVAPLAKVLFPVAPLRWAAARQHSPDMMLARKRDGTAQWVLGELHLALNTLESRVFRTQCDDPDELVAATAADMRHGRVVPLYPRDATSVSSRTYPPPALDPPGLYQYWSFGSDDGHCDGAEATPGTAILVEEGPDGELIGRDAAGGWSAPVLEFFGEFLSALAVNLFKIREPTAHAPRVLIDDMVVCRESWSVPACEIPVPRRRSDDYAYENLRTWASGRGMPRHVFVRTPQEPKPFLVDFSSPLLMGTLGRAVRRCRAHADALMVEFVEMCPGPEELWLTDEDGHRYTAEFRAIAVDTIGY